MNNDQVKVFVTYSWEAEEHNDKVISFTNFLRQSGFNAEIDRLLFQEETAIDFIKMMHKGINNYNKVIVVLSKGYKEKAETFSGGVGLEYTMILKDIDANPQKYILVTLDGYNIDSVPLFFKGRQVVDLSSKDNNSINELFAKLADKKIISFADVESNKPEIKTKDIQSFTDQKKKIN